MQTEQTIERQSTPFVNWSQIKWNKVETDVRRFQERIFRATQVQDWKKVRSLQKLLASSYFNKLLAIRRVTKENQGRKTAGIDGLLYDTPEKRWQLSQEPLDYRGHHPRPVKRVHIPKADGSQRPLGIPTIRDRVLQAIIKTALEPEWEARFEPNSYGFRPGRRAMDAIGQIWLTLSKPICSSWILDADISKCFDNIAHEPLLQRVPVFQRIINRWLKAGVIELGNYTKTEQGTPQGGVLSPLLANIALDGMERLFGMETETGRSLSPSRRKGINKGISLIRYADDFVVIAPTKDVLLTYVIPKLQIFLQERGLNFNQKKTRIIHRTEGFNFLGFTVKYWKTNHSAILLCKPQKQKILNHLRQSKEVLKTNKQTTTENLIKRLNPIIRGWANYYRHANAKKVFNYINYRLFKMLWKWVTRRHPSKTTTWCKQRYFKRVGQKNWVFGTTTATLFNPTSIPIKPYFKVTNFASPYNPSQRTYWEKCYNRQTIKIANSTRKRKLLQRQQGKCGLCELVIRPEEEYEIHHIVPRSEGGTDLLTNLLLVHAHCHQQIS